MKFALIDNIRAEATKGSKGICPRCGSALIAKCGSLKVHHCAHKATRTSDLWWENETEWHRQWKSHRSKVQLSLTIFISSSLICSNDGVSAVLSSRLDEQSRASSHEQWEGFNLVKVWL